jgi:hypothetical protein
MAISSGAVVALVLRERGWMTYCNLGTLITHIQPTILTSVSGLVQIHCAFHK